MLKTLAVGSLGSTVSSIPNQPRHCHATATPQRVEPRPPLSKQRLCVGPTIWSPTPRSDRNLHPETAGLCAAYGSRRREPGVFSKGAEQTRGAGRRTGWRPHRVLKTAIGRFYNQQLDTCRVTIWTINCTQWALGVSDIESALRQHRAGPALAADHLKACQQLELRRIRSHNAQFALIAQHDQAVPSRDDRPLTESLLTPLTSPLQPRNKVLCAVWTAESFASA